MLHPFALVTQRVPVVPRLPTPRVGCSLPNTFDDRRKLAQLLTFSDSLTADMPIADSRLTAAMRCAALMAVVVAGGTWGFWLIETEWGVWKSLYFTLITVTTVGYGDQGLSESGEKFAAVMLLSGIGCFTYSVSTLVHLALDRDAARKRKMQKTIDEFTDHTIVCGYGRMGRAICDQLIAGGQRCVVIECQEAGFEKAIEDGRPALHGVASEDDVLIAAGVERAKAVISVVDSDADNMYVVVSARGLNSQCSIVARAETDGAARKMERAGANFVVLPHRMAGENVAEAVLNPRLARVMRSGSENLDRLVLGETEVQPNSPLIGTTIQEFGVGAADLVFVAISRGEGELTMRPGGNQVIHEGDILLCAGRKRDLQFIQDAGCPSLRI